MVKFGIFLDKYIFEELKYLVDKLEETGIKLFFKLVMAVKVISNFGRNG